MTEYQPMFLMRADGTRAEVQRCGECGGLILSSSLGPHSDWHERLFRQMMAAAGAVVAAERGEGP